MKKVLPAILSQSNLDSKALNNNSL